MHEHIGGHTINIWEEIFGLYKNYFMSEGGEWC
jgi:hypothetical protein